MQRRAKFDSMLGCFLGTSVLFGTVSCKTVTKKFHRKEVVEESVAERKGPSEEEIMKAKILAPPENFVQPTGMDRAASGPLATSTPMADASSELTQGSEEEISTSYGLVTAPVTSPKKKICASFDSGDIRPLSCVPIPRPSRTDIKNQAAAIVLGKALFWDIQAGGDGKTACATCHFLAGADPRLKNVLNPGPDEIFASGGVSGPGQLYKLGVISNDDRAGSPGVVNRQFKNINRNIAVAADNCAQQADPIFQSFHQVTGRNTPTSIGIVYYRQLFWDGRASHIFNGNDPFGNTGNAAAPAELCSNCAIASQAVGPANNEVEMSCNGRTFNGQGSLAAKLLPRNPLHFQELAATDSVLGNYANSKGTGLGMVCDQAKARPCTYGELVDLAFRPEVAGKQAINNFSRLWGQAIQAYLATLNPTQTPMDLFLEGQSNALTTRQKKGFSIFKGKADCAECHSGAELSDASLSYIKDEGLISEDGGDTGFHNIGVRPTEEDLGRAGPGPNGIPFAEQASTSTRGAFKTPMLRNIKLTAPYFHNGGVATLEALVAFYARGGDFKNPEKDRHMVPRSLDAGEQTALVDFLRNGLTDPRVELQKAPFDHPSLPFPSAVTLKAVGSAGGIVSYVDPKGKVVTLP